MPEFVGEECSVHFQAIKLRNGGKHRLMIAEGAAVREGIRP
jgi:hypothetical protein